MKSYIIYYSCLTILARRKVLTLADLDNMTEKDMVKNNPVVGSVYLTGMLL